MMTELTEVERLTAEKAKIEADLAAAVRLADQRVYLLPNLEARLARMDQRLAPLTEERFEVAAAIKCIRDGFPTDYRLRRPRKPKAAEGAA